MRGHKTWNYTTSAIRHLVSPSQFCTYPAACAEPNSNRHVQNPSTSSQAAGDLWGTALQQYSFVMLHTVFAGWPAATDTALLHSDSRYQQTRAEHWPAEQPLCPGAQRWWYVNLAPPCAGSHCWVQHCSGQPEGLKTAYLSAHMAHHSTVPQAGLPM